MKANLKALWCDHFLLEEYQPPECDDFSLWLELSIGIHGEEGSDYFRLKVCTPEWLCKHHWLPELMRHTLLVRKYDLNEITKTITDYIDQCEGNDWMEIAQKLSRFLLGSMKTTSHKTINPNSNCWDCSLNELGESGERGNKTAYQGLMLGTAECPGEK